MHQELVKLASYARQNNLAVALREVRRTERTLCMIDWLLSTDRQGQNGLNRSEAQHAPKNVLWIERQGEVVVERKDAGLRRTKPAMSRVLFKTPSKIEAHKSVRMRCHISSGRRFSPRFKVTLDETAL